jgi:hypothetical protein
MHAANNPKEAIQVQGRALAFYVQLRGYDCAPVMACHERLSIFHGSAGSAAGALSHSRAHCYMLELGGGVRHPELSSAYLRMGQVCTHMCLFVDTVHCCCCCCYYCIAYDSVLLSLLVHGRHH